MDIMCLNCGEPWDMSELADVGTLPPHEQQAEDWDIRGGKPYSCPCCKANGGRQDSEKMEAIREISDLLGDDIDGLACELEDAEMLGLFE